jgi:hypothetical protein
MTAELQIRQDGNTPHPHEAVSKVRGSLPFFICRDSQKSGKRFCGLKRFPVLPNLQFDSGEYKHL